MSFNRLDYDKCAYKKELEESTSPLEYWLFLGKYENKTECVLTDHTNNLKQVEKAIVENELYNLERPATKCPELKYNKSNAKEVPKYSTPRVCEGIHYITPSGLERPKKCGFDPVSSRFKCNN